MARLEVGDGIQAAEAASGVLWALADAGVELSDVQMQRAAPGWS